MTSHSSELDLRSNSRREIADKILSIANSLFESVKNAPISVRASFPAILRNNNFALTVYVTKKYAFLEVTSKFRAQKSREPERVSAYRQIFNPKDSGKPALIGFDNARLCRISNLTLEGAHAFGLGSDISFCIWDSKNSLVLNGRPISNTIDVLYVVGFGAQIREDDAWQEFDALIRVTLADWSTPK